MGFQGFRYVGHVILGLKINKHPPNILLKTALKTMLQLGAILEPTCLYFGIVLGAKLGPNWQ